MPAPRLSAQKDVCRHIERVDDLQFLMDDRNAAACGVRRRVHDTRHAIEPDVARVGPVDASQNLH